MTPEDTNPPQTAASSSDGPGERPPEAARRAVEAVLAECKAQIAEEKAKPKPDEWAIRRWVDRRASASTDLRSLEADPTRAEAVLARNDALLASFRTTKA
ncbi:MAG: hypothetical protein QG622_1966 [Actinomycetota bacterium]|nr:hypothetical protein [Actinomycetota bacterium]